jgi:hypothetical protein
MATHTLSDFLPHNDRDLNQAERDTLEAMVDAAGIEAVVQGLSEICGAKADHIAHAWQDAAGQAVGHDGRSVRRGVHQSDRPLTPHQRACTRSKRMQALTPASGYGSNQ